MSCKIIASRPNAKNTGFYADVLVNVPNGTAVASMYSKSPVLAGDIHEIEFSVYQGKLNPFIGSKRPVKSAASAEPK